MSEPMSSSNGLVNKKVTKSFYKWPSRLLADLFQRTAHHLSLKFHSLRNGRLITEEAASQAISELAQRPCSAFNDTEHMRRFAFRCGRRRVLDLIKQEARRQKGIVSLGQMDDDGRTIEPEARQPNKRLEELERLRRLRDQWIRDLPASLARIAHLTTVELLNDREIARQLYGESAPDSVRQRIRRQRKAAILSATRGEEPTNAA